MPTWMKIAPTSAATNRSGWKWCSNPASAVPTSTGAIAAGSVRSRAAISQIRTALIGPCYARRGNFEKSGRALLQVGVAPLLRLLGHVEEQVGVVGELLDAGHPVLVGVEARLHHPQRERRDLQHLPAPLTVSASSSLERHDGVDQTHLERLLGVVLAAQEPDLLGLLGADQPGQFAGAEAAVERADLRDRPDRSGRCRRRSSGRRRCAARGRRRSPSRRPSRRSASAAGASGRAGR